MYQYLELLSDIKENIKKSDKFDNAQIDKLFEKIASSIQVNDKLMQLHWFIMQISSETDLKSVARLTLNTLYGLLNPRSCSLYLMDDFGVPYEYDNLAKTICLGCETCNFVKAGLDNPINKSTDVACSYDYTRNFTLFKRDGSILGYLVGYFQGSEIEIKEDVQLFLDMFTVQIGLAIEGVMMQAKLETLACTDELTGLANKRVLMSRLEEELLRSFQSRLQKEPHNGVGFILFDVDNFKNYNDTFGHVAGDVVLKKVGAIIRKTIGDLDVGARYGGEEMCVIVHNATVEETMKLAYKIRKAIEDTKFDHRVVTVSGGIAHYPTYSNLDVKEFINAADIALYTSKNTGKNKVTQFIQGG